MKKYLIIAAVLAVVTSIVGCKNDDDAVATASEMQQFMDDLGDMQSAKFDLLDRAKTRTTADDYEDISEEEVMAIAHKLDSITQKFCLDHANLLASYTLQVIPTEDEIELMKVDTDLLMNFIHNNFSQEFYEVSRDYLFGNVNGTRALRPLGVNANPLELVIIDNMETTIALGDIYGPVTMMHSNRGQLDVALKMCTDNYNNSMSSCSVLATSAALVASFCGCVAAYFTGGATAEAIPWATATSYLATYAPCARSAKNTYNKCKKTAYDNYG